MKSLLSILFLAAACLQAQPIVVQPGSLNQAVQTRPAAIATSLTCLVGFASGCTFRLPVTSSDPYLCSADFTATGQTITMQDANGVPWIVSGGALGSSGNPAGWEWHSSATISCRWFPGGVYIQANATGVTGKLSVSYQAR